MKLTRNKQQQLNEISQYVRDLEKVTHLRDAAAKKSTADIQDTASAAEWSRYEEVLKVMQLVLVELNQRLI